MNRHTLHDETCKKAGEGQAVKMSRTCLFCLGVGLAFGLAVSLYCFAACAATPRRSVAPADEERFIGSWLAAKGAAPLVGSCLGLVVGAVWDLHHS